MIVPFLGWSAHTLASHYATKLFRDCCDEQHHHECHCEQRAECE